LKPVVYQTPLIISLWLAVAAGHLEMLPLGRVLAEVLGVQ
jgi:hypothetical protein